MPYNSVKYAFTVTLQPQLYKSSIQDQYDNTYLELSKRLKCLASTVALIAECTPNKNIHYHGMIQFHVKTKDHILDFVDLFRKSKIFGYKNIKQIEDESGWLEYITKDVLHTRSILNRPPIILNEFDTNETLKGFEYDLQYLDDIIIEQ